jgi:hypothetical protein
LIFINHILLCPNEQYHVTPTKRMAENKATMKKSDGKDPDAITDKQRFVTDEAGDLVTGDVK